MITANDLKNIDYFLIEEQKITINSNNKGLINYLRNKISKELCKISIKIK
jgi:hypothetical protein